MKNIRSAILRLGHAWPWIIVQFAGILVFILIGLAWTRVPDKSAWDVFLTLTLPILLLITLLLIETATMRRLMDNEADRARLVWATGLLAFWVALGMAAWLLLDWCDTRIPNWASYLNSRFSSSNRATVFTYDHLQHWLTLVEWVLRWIIVPGKLILCATATSHWGWRVPFRRVLRVMLSWRWWLAVILCSLVAIAWTSTFFAGIPHGSVSHQVWAVALKLTGVYILAIAAWLALLAWAAALLSWANPSSDPGEFAPVPALVSPSDDSKRASVRLPLPEGSSDGVGDA
ncbi:MAG: hypothetical protein JST28_19875 [Acidobacteria bacterium]|nr:hypothetical protein [Acidobacteriota bacterium]